MLESGVGRDMLRRLVSDCQLDSRGIYVPTQEYDHREILTMVGRLSRHLETPAPGLLKSFGCYLSKSLTVRYPWLFHHTTDVFVFLEQLPKRISMNPEIFEIRGDLHETLIVKYNSNIPLADLVEGLLCESINFYRQDIKLTRIEAPSSGGKQATFILHRESETSGLE